MRRFVRPGNRAGSPCIKAQESIWFRDMSKNSSDEEKTGLDFGGSGASSGF